MQSVRASLPWASEAAALVLQRPAWHAEALCREYPEVNWFPDRGEDIRPAKQICGQCLVREECLAWALARGSELMGVWGGMSQQDRHRLARTRGVEEDEQCLT